MQEVPSWVLWPSFDATTYTILYNYTMYLSKSPISKSNIVRNYGHCAATKTALFHANLNPGNILSNYFLRKECAYVYRQTERSEFSAYTNLCGWRNGRFLPGYNRDCIFEMLCDLYKVRFGSEKKSWWDSTLSKREPDFDGIEASYFPPRTRRTEVGYCRVITGYGK